MRHRGNQGALRAAWIGCALTASGVAGLAQNPGEYLSYSWKGVAFQPQFDTTALFTDNLFYGAGATRVSDFVFTVSPGFRLQYGRDGENQIAFEYMHDETVVLDHSDFNSRQNRLDLTVRYVQGRLRLEGKDSVQFLSSLLGGSVGTLGQLVDRVLQSDDYRLTYDWTEKTDFYLRGSHTAADYDKRTFLLDQRTLEGTLGTSYQWTPKTRLTVDGFYGATSIAANAVPVAASDSRFYGGYVGIRGSFTPKLSGSARVGYEQRSFVSGDSVSASTPALSFDLAYQLTPMTSMTLRYDRRTFPSPQFASQISISDSVIFQVNQLVGTSGRWLVRGTVRYNHNDLSSTSVASGGQTIDVQRTDTLMAAGVALIYQPQPWLGCIAAYDFENFDISFANQAASGLLQVVSYHNNRLSLSVAIGF